MKLRPSAAPSIDPGQRMGGKPVGRLGKYLVNQRLIVLPACIPLISLALSLTAPDAMKSVGIKQLCSHQD